MRSNYNGSTQMTVARHQPRGLDYFLYSNKLKAEERKAALTVASSIDHDTLGVNELDLPYITTLTKRSERQRDEFIDMVLDGKDFTMQDVKQLGGTFREGKVINKSIMEAKLNAQKMNKTLDFTRKAGLQTGRSNYYNAIYNKSVENFGGTFGEDGSIRQFEMAEAPDYVDMEANLVADLRAAAPHMTRAEAGHIISNLKPFSKVDKKTGRAYHGFDMGVNKEKYENFDAIQGVLNDHATRVNTPGTDEYNLIEFENQYGAPTGLNAEGAREDMINRFGTTAEAYMNEEMRNMPNRYVGLGFDKPVAATQSVPGSGFGGYNPTTPNTVNTSIRQTSPRTIPSYIPPEKNTINAGGKTNATENFHISGGTYEIHDGKGGKTIVKDSDDPTIVPDMALYNSNTEDFNYSVWGKSYVGTLDALHLLDGKTNSSLTLDKDSQRTMLANDTFVQVEELEAAQFDSDYGFDDFGRTNYNLRITQEDLDQAQAGNEKAINIVDLKEKIYEGINTMKQDDYEMEVVNPSYIPLNLNELVGAKPGSTIGNEVFFEELSKKSPELRATLVLEDDTDDQYKFNQNTTVKPKDAEDTFFGTENMSVTMGRLMFKQSLGEGGSIDIPGAKLSITSKPSQVSDDFRMSDQYKGTKPIEGKTNADLDVFDKNYRGAFSFEVTKTSGTDLNKKTEVARVYIANPFPELTRPIDYPNVLVKTKSGDFGNTSFREVAESLVKNGQTTEFYMGYTDETYEGFLGKGQTEKPITIERKNKDLYIIKGLNKVGAGPEVKVLESRKSFIDEMTKLSNFNTFEYIPYLMTQEEGLK